MTNISKVQINDTKYGIEGDNQHIESIIATSPTIADIYSKLGAGTDYTTLQVIYERLAALESNQIDPEILVSLQNQINQLSSQIHSSDTFTYFVYKIASSTPSRPSNSESYPPSGWLSTPPTSISVGNNLYLSMARVVNGNYLNWADGYRWTSPVSLGNSNSGGSDISITSSIALYKVGTEESTRLSDAERAAKQYPSGWSTTPGTTVSDTQSLYMITAKTVNGEYQYVNGYIWSVPLRIGNGKTSGTGADGKGYNYVYALRSEDNTPVKPTFSVAEIERQQHITQGGVTWYDRPQGVSEQNKYEYISVSTGSDDEGWSTWSTPVLWSKYGERGMDGDAVEYIYKRAETEIPPTIPYYDAGSSQYQQDDFIPNGWTDNPLGVDANTSFEYVATRKKKSEVWQRFEGPWLWSKYGKDGAAGVVNGYLMTCNNSSVIADDDLFTKNDALSRFNALTSATFTLQKTDGSSINPTYSVGNDSNLPSGIQAVMNSNTLSYTGSFTSTISDGDVFYVNVNGKVNNEVVATLRQTILVKNFSSGESYRLILTPTSKKVGTDGKFESNFTIDVKFLVISNVLSTNVNFAQQDLYYDIEIEGDSSNKAAQNVQTQKTTLNVADQTAPEYYVVNLYKRVNNSGVLVDSQTISIYKDGEKGDKGDPGSGSSGSSQLFEVSPPVLYFANNSVNTYVTVKAQWSPYTSLKVTCGGVTQNIINGQTTFSVTTLNNLIPSSDSNVSNLEFILKSGETQLASQAIPVIKAQQGINGAVLRYRGIWSEITGFNGVARQKATFECNSHTGTGNIDYIDVVSEKDNGELKYYQCVKKHSINPGSSSPTLTSTEHWQVADQFKFIFTDTLIADYISTHTIAADDVVITEKNSQGVTTDIVAGMTSSHVDTTLIGGTDAGDVRIWAGTTGTQPNIQNAPFQVTQEGKMVATNAVVQGEINADSGQFNGNIKANSFSINYPNSSDIAIQFRVLDAPIDNYPAGTPVIMIFKGEDTYIVDMTKLNQGASITYYESQYNLPSSVSGYTLEKLKEDLLNCHKVSSNNYTFAAQIDPTSRGNQINNTACIVPTSLFLAQSTDENNDKYFITSGGNKVLFTGYSVLFGDKVVSTGMAQSVLVTHTFQYVINLYNNGVVTKNFDAQIIGSVTHDYQGTITASNLSDMPVGSTFDTDQTITTTAPVITSSYTPNYRAFVAQEVYFNPGHDTLGPRT